MDSKSIVNQKNHTNVNVQPSSAEMPVTRENAQSSKGWWLETCVACVAEFVGDAIFVFIGELGFHF
jgi:hypothetical protein